MSFNVAVFDRRLEDLVLHGSSLSESDPSDSSSIISLFASVAARCSIFEAFANTVFLSAYGGVGFVLHKRRD